MNTKENKFISSQTNTKANRYQYANRYHPNPRVNRYQYANQLSIKMQI